MSSLNAARLRLNQTSPSSTVLVGLAQAVQQIVRDTANFKQYAKQHPMPAVFGFQSELRSRPQVKPLTAKQIASNVIDIPVALADVAVAPAIARTAELTADAAWNRYMNDVASFVPAHLRNNFALTAAELKLVQESPSALLDLVKTRIEAVQYSFQRKIAEDLGNGPQGSAPSIAGPAADRIGAIDFVLSTSNTYGNIDQSSATNWASNVTANAGSFDVQIMDFMRTNIKRVGGAVDLITFSADTTGIDVYSRYKDFYRRARVIEVVNGYMDVGIDNFREEGGAAVIQDFDHNVTGTTGVVRMLDTSTWHVFGDTQATKVDDVMIALTDAMGTYFNMFAQVVCVQPRRNGIITGFV